jgi:S-formylglutathione hydrolase FrmB
LGIVIVTPDTSLRGKGVANDPKQAYDQGDKDNFLEEQLKPNSLVTAASANNYPLGLRSQLLFYFDFH